jgi:hypothetical protein
MGQVRQRGICCTLIIQFNHAVGSRADRPSCKLRISRCRPRDVDPRPSSDVSESAVLELLVVVGCAELWFDEVHIESLLDATPTNTISLS